MPKVTASAAAWLTPCLAIGACVLLPRPVYALCTPAPGSNVTAVCTGNTAGGYGGAGFSNLNVTVESAASVTGAGTGIFFNTGALTNNGLVNAPIAVTFNAGSVSNNGTIQGTTGIDAGSATVTNRGNITATVLGITAAGGNLLLDNYGLISGLFGIFTGTGEIKNAGLISATGATAIDFSTSIVLSNLETGTISAQTAAVTGPLASISNQGRIISATAAAIDVTALSLDNSGTVSGATAAVRGAQGTIVNSGSVLASGGPAINLSGNLDLKNSGSISGTSDGVRAGNATISNAGTIGGLSGNGIRLSGSGAVTNAGRISGGSVGLVVFGNLDLVNDGTIYGSNSALAVNGATVKNSGAILSNSVAIDAGNADIVNSGTIAGRFIGITTNQLKLFNSGAVTVSEPGASAIYSSHADITNGGLIAGAGINELAISFSPGTGVLTSLPGSRIIGRIDLGGSGSAAIFRGGNFNYTFDSLAGVSVSSSTPFAVQGARVATIDPTPFAVTGRNLMGFASAASSSLPTTGAPVTATGAPLGYAGEGPADKNVREAFAAVMAPQGPSASYAGGFSIWARGFAGERDQASTGALIHTVNRFQGGLMGGDWQIDPVWRLGGFVGGGAMQTSEDLNLSAVNSDLVFGGAFAHGRFGATFLEMTLQLGHLSQQGTRLISNNQVAGGLERAAASSGGFYAVPEVALGRHIELGQAVGTSWRLTPLGRIRYLGGSMDGYAESGALANATVDRRTLSELEERVEMRLTGTARVSSSLVLTTSTYAGILGAQRLGDATVNASLLGQAIPFVAPGAAQAWGYLGGGAFEMRNGTAGLFIAAEYLRMSDSSVAYGGRGGLRVAF